MNTNLSLRYCVKSTVKKLRRPWWPACKTHALEAPLHADLDMESSLCEMNVTYSKIFGQYFFAERALGNCSFFSNSSFCQYRRHKLASNKIKVSTSAQHQWKNWCRERLNSGGKSLITA